VFLILQCLAAPALAWDATAHRLNAYVVWELLSAERRSALVDLLREHPRFTRDFRSEMPDFIAAANPDAQARWLFGQAAVWPDHVRGLSEGLRERYNRPQWHWIDGRWVRGEARLQGNVYILIPRQPDLPRRTPEAIDGEEDASNVVLALEYTARQLRDEQVSAAQRAVALCWVLHLAADLHQPLHTGALVSAGMFPDGDRGGNLLETPDGNLHRVWDSALRGLPFDETLKELMSEARRIRNAPPADLAFDSERWLRESRRLLHQAVYTPEIRSMVREHERRGQPLPDLTLGNEYRQRMQRIARERLALAGLRLTHLLQ